MGHLFEAATSPETLSAVWTVMLADHSPDEPRSALTSFTAEADERLAQLTEELASGTYRPHPLHDVTITDPDGEPRKLQVPSVRDRILERAILLTVTPLVDPWLGASSYAYRPGLGVLDAVQAVAELRDAGLPWVLRSDIDNCFPSIPVPLTLRRFGALVDDAELTALVKRLAGRASVTEHGALRAVPGLPQGSPLSPLLANLLLTTLDDALLDSGFPVVRYADDFVVATTTRDEAWEAARVATRALDGLGMRLDPAKSEVMSFDEGFCFLGEDFGPRYPPALGGREVEAPARKVVYLATQGAGAHIRAGRFIVESAHDETLLDVPLSHVGRVVCFGSVGVSAGLRTWAFEEGVDVVFASRRGSFLGGHLAAGGGPRLSRLKVQLAAADTADRTLTWSRLVVEAKVRKQIVLLQRFGRREARADVSDALTQMRDVLAMLPQSGSRDEVMGIEGAAARAYFSALSALMPVTLRFAGRSRRPPLDVVNSALSFGYTVLLGECETALAAAGLDPSVGLMHANEDRRPNLALDLMEEFRPLVVDQLVLSAGRRGELRLEHGHSEDGKLGVYLTKAGRSAVLDAYENRMLQRTSGALPGFTGTLRRHLYRQATRLASWLSDPAAEWTGLSWR